MDIVFIVVIIDLYYKKEKEKEERRYSYGDLIDIDGKEIVHV